MHEVLVNRLGGISLPRKSVVRLTDRPDMTLDVYRGRKTTMQCNGKTGCTFIFFFKIRVKRDMISLPSYSSTQAVYDLLHDCAEN